MVCRKRLSLLNVYLFVILILSAWISFYHIHVISNYVRNKKETRIIFDHERLSNNTYSHKQNKAEPHSASACLIIRDDNPRLIEWLAYHYQVLPLRNLVVTSDPSARTSPTEILNRWRDKVPNLNILEWTEKDYSYNKFQAEMTVNWIDDPEKRAVKLLINRQYAFYGHCASHFKRNNQTWVFIIDADEYIVFNRVNTSDPLKQDEVTNIIDLVEHGLNSDQAYGVAAGMTQDIGHIKRHANEMRRDMERLDFESSGLEALSLRKSLPRVDEMSVVEYVYSIKDNPSSPFNQDPCYIMPRLFMSAVESKPMEVARLPRHFDPLTFDTMRYYRHAQKGGFPWNTYGKSMIDVSRVAYNDLSPVRAHKASPSCSQEDPFEDVYYAESLLRVQHYIGSIEAYISKGDKRRPRNKYLIGSRIDEGTTFDTQPWLKAFIDNVGLENALYLLGKQ